jgi:predicted metal-dependent enzyme (double-stranded beta helix superfamily)
MTAIADVLGLTPAARDLDEAELTALVAGLAARPADWGHLVEHRPDARTYVELYGDAHVTVWLICWMDDHDTGFHDHDRSAGAVGVAAGAIREERLAIGRPPAERVAAAGEAFSFGPADIHRVAHAGGEPAVTIHAYSPPLSRMGAYEVLPSGVLRRWSILSEEELAPIQKEEGARSSGSLASF